MEREQLMVVQLNLEKGIASGGEAIKFRCFVTKENEKQFPNLVKFINELTI